MTTSPDQLREAVARLRGNIDDASPSKIVVVERDDVELLLALIQSSAIQAGDGGRSNLSDEPSSDTSDSASPAAGRLVGAGWMDDEFVIRVAVRKPPEWPLDAIWKNWPATVIPTPPSQEPGHG